MLHVTIYYAASLIRGNRANCALFCDNLDWLVSKLDRLEASSGTQLSALRHHTNDLMYVGCCLIYTILPFGTSSLQAFWRCCTAFWLKALKSWTSSRRTTSSLLSLFWTSTDAITRSASLESLVYVYRHYWYGISAFNYLHDLVWMKSYKGCDLWWVGVYLD